MLEFIWLWLDRLTIVIAMFAAVASGMAWIKSRRLLAVARLAEQKRRAPITIRLQCGDKSLDLPYRPRRDQLSRQELTGLLSFYYGETRFDPVIVRKILENGDLSRTLAGDNLDSNDDETLRVNVDEGFFEKVSKGLEENQKAIKKDEA